MGIVSEVVLSAQGLRVHYPTPQGRNVVVNDLGLDLSAGEVVGMLGESGSGKSSVGLALLGIVRHPGALEGSVHFQGRDLLSLTEEQLREVRGRSIGLITQKPRQSLVPFHNVGTQISRVYRAHVKASKDEAREHALDLLRQVGINDPERRIGAYPHELSGGMAQRALISMALSAHPQILIADEPTSGLDVTIQAQFLDRMWRRAKDDNTGVLLITQDLGIIANYCDRVVVMHQGQIIEDRPTAEFFADPQEDYSKRILALSKGAATSGRPARDGVAAVPVDGVPSVADGRELLTVDGLTKTFQLADGKRLQAVADVTLTVPRGTSLGLVGESGSGKTTVGRMIMRLLDPDSGQIHFEGRRVDNLDGRKFRALRSRMQIVFQDPSDSLNPRWSIRRILREPLDLHTDLSSSQKNARIDELLELVRLPTSLGDERVHGLSAGEQQRVCLARALATDPAFLVLDEPTSALPPAARVEMIALLKRLQQELDLSFIFISHDLSTVRELCGYVAVMYLSQIVEHGSIGQVFRDPQHPYTRALLDAVLFHDPLNRRVDRESVEGLQGEIPSPVNLPTGCYLASRCPYALPRCVEERQVLQVLPDSRLVRCWRAAEAPDSDDRLPSSEVITDGIG